MKAMKLTLVACLVLTVLACTDPYSFEPGDPTKPNPPDAPELVQPGNGWQSDLYAYPQGVGFGWQAVSGGQFYQIEVYRDSLLRGQYLVYANERVTQPAATASFSTYGWYYWRVRAASRNWNNYTAWSATFRFGLPNPAK
jgi:hypothetical protein